MAREFNVLALVKGPERFVFVYDDMSRDCLIGAFSDMASNPASNLTWFDALVLTKKVREQTAESIVQAEANDEWSLGT